jgi:hypothetical protein
VISLLAFGLALAACARPPAEGDGAAAVPEKAPVGQAASTALKPLAQRTFGGAITERSTTSLDALLREPGKFQTKTIRTEGVVSAVCKSMGCWMEIAEPGGQAHIKMAGHSFFVPKDASGHRAVVQGTVLKPSNDECSQEAKEQTGAVAKIEIEATGVEFLD